MTEQLYRLTIRDAVFSGPIAGLIVVTGYIVNAEPESPIKRNFLRPVIPDEPDGKTEIGYSIDPLEPLTIVHRSRKFKITKMLFVLFRYIYDLYRTEGQTEFEFAELSAVFTGDDCGMSKNALEVAIRRLAKSLEKIRSPFSLTYCREICYVKTKLT